MSTQSEVAARSEAGNGTSEDEIATPRVIVDHLEPGIADVRLIRSDKMNALDPAMFETLATTIAELANDPTVRVVVLSGEGRAFCAGLDRARFDGMAGDDADMTAEADALRLGPRTHGPANLPQQVAVGWRALPVPVIVAVHGVAFGGGLQIALGGDVRFVAPGTKLSLMELQWGIVPDMGGMALMRQLAGGDRIRELVYTARQFSGEEAVDYGLMTEVVDDPLAAALDLARTIAARNPEAVRAAKRLINEAEDADFASILAAESAAQLTLLGTPNQREAVRANLARRSPSFNDPAGDG